ncbi:MAG: hypothetical protein QM651_15135 [Rhodoblastus sp.]
MRWTKDQDPEGWTLWSGEIIIGFVVKRTTDGRYAWQVSGFRARHTVKGSGECVSMSAAKQALRRAFIQWLGKADLALTSNNFSEREA